MNGNLLHYLLQSGKDLHLQGIGKFRLDEVAAEIQHGASSLSAPSYQVSYSQKAGKSGETMAEILHLRYGITRIKSEKIEESWLAEVKSGLQNHQRFSIPDFGTLVSDLEGSIQFIPEKTRVRTGDAFGFRPIRAKQLAVRHPDGLPKEAPVIPLRPFEVHTARRKNPRVTAMAAAGLALTLCASALFWLTSQIGGETGQQAAIIPVPSKSTSQTEVKKAAAPLQTPALAEEVLSETAVPSASLPVIPPVSEENTLETTKPEIPKAVEEVKNTNFSSGKKNPEIRMAATKTSAKTSSVEKMASISPMPDPQEVSADSFHYFVIAGSFSSEKIAESARQKFKKEGYPAALHRLTEKRLIRVSIGGFATKEEALEFLNFARPNFDSELWILNN